MIYLDNETYRNDIKTAIEHTVDFEEFYRKKILILGATGLIGSVIIDCFLYANQELDADITVYAVSRSMERLIDRFGMKYENHLNFIESDVTLLDIEVRADYIIHAASYGHPRAFREMPVEVLLSNVIGVQKVMDIARQNTKCRVLYISSGEVQEQVDHLTARACYPMGKRVAETLCISYYAEYDIDVVIARPCHTFGANAAFHDNRAATQFLTSGAKSIHIKMYSAGRQERSFSYVADCVSGLLTVLSKGKTGVVYGVSSGESCTIKEFADQCAAVGKCRVESCIPTSDEKRELSPVEKQVVSNRDLVNLGWWPAFSIEQGIVRSIEIIREMDGN